MLQQRKVGSFEAKTKLPELIRELEKSHGKIIITRKGKPVAVLQSYQSSEGKGTKELIQKMRDLRNKIGMTKPKKMTLKQMMEEGRG